MELNEIPGGALMLDNFQARVQMVVNRKVKVKASVYFDLSLEDLLTVVRGVFDLRRDQVIKRSRGDLMQGLCRQLFCYFALQYCGYPMNAVANFVNRNHSTVHVGKQTIEDLLSINDALTIRYYHAIKSQLL